MQHNKKAQHYFLPAKFYYDKAVLNLRQPFQVLLPVRGILNEFLSGEFVSFLKLEQRTNKKIYQFEI
jgi:hypothetical protein